MKKALALKLVAASVVSTIGIPQMVQAQELEEVVVTGIRASIERGLDVKRNSRQIVDSISAEELGKFPDQNVAESLQRITGVAITRSRGGEGRFVTVRGLGQAFNTLTYNGRKLATENEGREFSFDVVASELISAAQVYKTPDAAQGDGSIGGRVNIETLKPLDRPGRKVAFSAGGLYEDLSEETNVKLSGVFSDTWANDTVGFVASVAYSERDIRTDVAESIFIFPNEDVDGDGIAQERVNAFSPSISSEERERLGATAALQFQINDVTRFTVDALYTSFESPALTSQYSFFPNPGLITNPVINDANQVISSTVNAIPGEPFSNIFDIVARRTESDTETVQIGFNLEGQFNDRFRYNTDFSYSEADGVRDNLQSASGSGSFFVVSFPGLNFSQTFTGDPVPDVTFSTLNGINTTQQVPIDQLTADAARLHFSRNSSNQVEDEILAFRTDLEFDWNDNVLLKFGYDYQNREKNRTVFDNIPSQCGSSDGTDVPFTCDRSQLFSDNLSAAELGQLLTVFDGESEGFLSGTSSNLPRNFVVPNIDIVEQAFVNLGARFGAASPLAAQFNPNESSEIEEEIFGAYLQADWDGALGGTPYRATLGARLSYTDLTSSGVGAVIEAVGIDSVSGNNNFTVNASGAIEEDNDYFEFLPAFNISFDLSEQLIFRGGLSRTLTRPTFNDLSTVFAVTSVNAGGEAISASNPQLDPTTSNNLDLSLEYYGENGLTLSAAVFYKDIDGFITNQNVTEAITINNATDATTGAALPPQTINFLVSGPQNGDDAEVTGLELAAQKLWDNGFGVSANVTLADGENVTNGVETDLENISDTTFNASVFYENERWSARVSINNRSDFLLTTEGEGGLPVFTDDFTQVDISLSYSFTDNLTAFLEGININDEESFDFSETEDFLELFEENGARYLFGVRGSF